MKKNRTMRIAAVMLVLALLTTCIISGSFAKYTTGGTTTDEAHVAAFGVTVGATTDSLFAETYARTEALQTSATITNSVVADSEVVAPGTNGTLTAFTFSGTPEVAVRVTYSIDTLTLENWLDGDGNFYCPLVFTIGSADATKVDVDGASYSSAAEFKTAIQNALNGFVKELAPGVAVSNADNFAISWSWPFYTTDANDAKDTFLGNATTKGTIEVEFTATVTQID